MTDTLNNTENLNLEGQDRLKSAKVINEVLPSDFNYNNGRFTAFPLGDFSVMFLHPKSGAILDESEVGSVMKENKSLTLYAPMAREGDLMFSLAESFIEKEDGKVWRTTKYFSKFENGRWNDQKSGTISIATLNSGKVSRTI